MLPDEVVRGLHARALAARKNAYAPYSNYLVGAALLANSGETYLGANVENAAYPSSMCAERAAIFAAVASGERAFDAVVIVTENGGAPCGACRQVMSEFGDELRVITTDLDGNIHLNSLLKELLPNSFGPGDLIAG